MLNSVTVPSIVPASAPDLTRIRSPTRNGCANCSITPAKKLANREVQHAERGQADDADPGENHDIAKYRSVGDADRPLKHRSRPPGEAERGDHGEDGERGGRCNRDDLPGARRDEAGGSGRLLCRGHIERNAQPVHGGGGRGCDGRSDDRLPGPVAALRRRMRADHVLLLAVLRLHGPNRTESRQMRGPGARKKRAPGPPDSPGAPCRWPGVQSLNRGPPTGRTGLPFIPAITPAAEAYQATNAVMMPRIAPTLVAPAPGASPLKAPMASTISVISRVRNTPKTAPLTWLLQISM